MVFKLAGKRSRSSSELGGDRHSGGGTSLLFRLILLVIVGGLAVGAVFLANWEIPAPSATVEKVLSNDRFPY
jgi:hypothetical protein